MKLDDRMQWLICSLCILFGQVEAHQAGLSAQAGAGIGLSACQREISADAGMITFTCPWPNNLLAACQPAELRANPACRNTIYDIPIATWCQLESARLTDEYCQPASLAGRRSYCKPPINSLIPSECR